MADIMTEAEIAELRALDVEPTHWQMLRRPSDDGGRMMAYVNFTVDLNDVASSLTEDAINIGELLNELGDHYGDTLGRAAYDILEGMGKEGRHFVRLLAAAIEAEGE